MRLAGLASNTARQFSLFYFYLASRELDPIWTDQLGGNWRLKSIIEAYFGGEFESEAHVANVKREIISALSRAL